MQSGQIDFLAHAPLWVCLVAVVIGMCVHVMFKLQDSEQRGEPVDIGGYLMGHKWTTVSVIVSSLFLIIVLYVAEGMGPIAAFGIGIACNSSGDRLRTWAETRK